MNVLSMFDLTGEKAIVTGGGQGLGREMALALAEAGADVAVVQRRVEVAEQTAEEIRKLGRDSFAMKVDVSKAEDVKNMVAAAKDRFGKIDILINNAGIAHHVPAEELSEEDWDTMIDINLKGVFLGSQMVGREMIKQKKGSIINIASMSGFIVNRPQPQAHYNTAKAGIVMLTKSLAMEWAKYNIRVNAIAPGYIKTPRLAQYLGPGKIGEEWVKLTPMGRPGEPFELKGLALFLASKASSFMTGSTIVIDGGYTCW